jgi:hypothetical protein
MIPFWLMAVLWVEYVALAVTFAFMRLWVLVLYWVGAIMLHTAVMLWVKGIK